MKNVTQLRGSERAVQEKDGTNRAGNGAKSPFFYVRFDLDLICLIDSDIFRCDLGSNPLPSSIEYVATYLLG